ncbi:MAG: high-potential iron-sulfur protein [Betaproteobacteria bacterium]
MERNRRVFMLAAIAGGAALSSTAFAQAKLDEKDPQAQALGYVADATKADKAKFPKYAAGQVCSNCTLYQASGACAIFGGKVVASKGWCSAYAKKAA